MNSSASIGEHEDPEGDETFEASESGTQRLRAVGSALLSVIQLR
ncbi:hypothetical protein HSB1_39770 [Halogranum salarium B-1]|uniref:Uncharacterized protein n=1 Tax=Halogranum salarium B-1 TaxID=1210908 RepID=J3JDM4_9EURY|nr:hypothetical protein HSB1_39770 [Halogranum salarium B-1]